MIKGGNKTTVAVGGFAGALATLGWWITGEALPTLVVPDSIVAASTVIISAVVTYLVPSE